MSARFAWQRPLHLTSTGLWLMFTAEWLRIPPAARLEVAVALLLVLVCVAWAGRLQAMFF